MAFKVIRTEAKVKEFSKQVIVAMTVLWFAAALFGAYIVWKNAYGLEALLDFVGQPMMGGIIGYMAKSALENREKIKKTDKESDRP